MKTLVFWTILAVFLTLASGTAFGGLIGSPACSIDVLRMSKEPAKLHRVDLQKEIELSETGAYYEKLRVQSNGIETVYQFLKEFQNNREEGHILGVSQYRDVFSALARSTGLQTWIEVYKNLGLNVNDPRHVDKFMSTIGNQDARLVFLVPRDLFSFPVNGRNRNGILQSEFSWLLQKGHEDVLRKTKFVYGAYQGIDAKYYEYLKAKIPDADQRADYIYQLLQSASVSAPDSFFAPQPVDTDALRRLVQ